MDASSSQDSLLEDHLSLINKFIIHRCSDYYFTTDSGKTNKCRMDVGSESLPGKELRETPTPRTDNNGSLRLEAIQCWEMFLSFIL